MRILRHGAASILLFAIMGTLLAQTDDNPFPDIIGRSTAVRPFDEKAPKVTLNGVITQKAVHIKQPNPYQYFRMAVNGVNTPEIWSVLLWASDSQTANLNPGVSVRILATPSKDGTRRVELVQPKGNLGSDSMMVNLTINPR
jgi:hypothetical protein